MKLKTKRIVCLISALLLIALFTLPSLAFTEYVQEVTQIGNNTQYTTIYSFSGPDNMYWIRDRNQFLIFNPTDNVQECRVVLTNYFTEHSQFYLITPYIFNQNESIRFDVGPNFSPEATFINTSLVGDDEYLEYFVYEVTQGEDGSDLPFGTQELWLTITLQPHRTASFEFAWNRFPSDFPADMHMTYDGLMAYTAAIWAVKDELYGYQSDFDFFNIFYQISQFSQPLDNENIYEQGYLQGFTQGQGQSGEYYNEGYSDGVEFGYSQGYGEGYKKAASEISMEGFEGITSLQQAYDKGVTDTIEKYDRNSKLSKLIPDIFNSLFSAAGEMLFDFFNYQTIFGLNVSGVIVTFLCLGLALAIFGFITSKVG